MWQSKYLCNFKIKSYLKQIYYFLVIRDPEFKDLETFLFLKLVVYIGEPRHKKGLES